MEFQPLYFADKLTIINPHGHIGVVTLWSKVDYVIERFRQAGVDLNPTTSPIAVFGNLYGNGLREMLRNLLYNPQIRVLAICGNDRSHSMQDLIHFFDLGLETVEGAPVTYRSPLPDIRVAPARIVQTSRLIDDLVRPELFPQPVPLIQYLGDPQETENLTFLIRDFFDSSSFSGLQTSSKFPRIEVPLPEVEVDHFPNNPRSHQVIRDTPLDAWIELLYILSRFGQKITLRKGDRLELQNIKVVVERPQFEEKRLQRYSLDPEYLRQYQKDIVRSKIRADKSSLKGQIRLPHWVQLRPDETYNYSERLRSHFGLDGLEECVRRLKKDSEDRKAYFTLWNNSEDLKAPSGHPCFVSLFFRKFQEHLTLTATFRAHNALDGWLTNFHGLMAIQKWVSERVELSPGPITVISHSISLDPKELDRAQLFIGKRPFKVRLDPMGYFRVTLDGQDILVEHRFEDVTLKEYRGKKAARLQHEIARDLALSDINHAIYLGRQLARAEMALQAGREFVQE